MSQSASHADRTRPAAQPRRSFTTLAAFLFGIPAAAGILALVNVGPLRETVLQRYLSHPVEGVEVLMFCCALGGLLAKALGSVKERRAFRQEALPPWDGQPVAAEEAARLLQGLRRLGRRWLGSSLGRRVAAVLDFVVSRGSTDGLDDQIRTLADGDALAFESSYALIRFITWAIPILGFLGTVLGITAAIAGVTPERLEHSLSSVTDGLALAFDATAVALALTMTTMFINFLVERLEEGVLLAVDAYVDEHLAHRFERGGAEGPGVGDELRRGNQALLRATEQLVQRQAELWARSLAEAQQQWAGTGRKQQEAVLAALEQGLERTLQSHARRLAELEQHSARQAAGLLERLGELATAVRQGASQQQAALAELARGVAAQTEALARLDAGTGQLLRLEEALSHNLSVLAGAGAFEQAVSSLSAAIHLLTARLGAAPAPGTVARIGPRPGQAA